MIEKDERFEFTGEMGERLRALRLKEGMTQQELTCFQTAPDFGLLAAPRVRSPLGRVYGGIVAPTEPDHDHCI